jgi:hypothetical protein
MRIYFTIAQLRNILFSLCPFESVIDKVINFISLTGRLVPCVGHWPPIHTGYTANNFVAVVGNKYGISVFSTYECLSKWKYSEDGGHNTDYMNNRFFRIIKVVTNSKEKRHS